MVKNIRERLFLFAVGGRCREEPLPFKMGMNGPSVVCIMVKTTTVSSQGQSWSTETTGPGVGFCTGAVCTGTGDAVQDALLRGHHPW